MPLRHDLQSTGLPGIVNLSDGSARSGRGNVGDGVTGATDDLGPSVRAMNWLHARLASLTRAQTDFAFPPEPETLGSYARGMQLMAGNYLFGGTLVEAAPGTPLFRIEGQPPAFMAEAHGFLWLDDLAAVGSAGARRLARLWLADWLAQSARGRGPAWTPDRTGRRLTRWIMNGLFLIDGLDRAQKARVQRALVQQVRFLARRWSAAPAGLPRIEALAGLIVAGLGLRGMERPVPAAATAIGREAAATIDADGAVVSRNPEELLEIFTLLIATASALADADHDIDPEHLEAIDRIAPTLRGLRHVDGGLARFHGGDRAAEGKLDRALAVSGVREPPHGGLAMGFLRVAHGRTSLILDAASPPRGAASVNAHASTLAIEITSGRRPLIVNCGRGRDFGEGWRKAARATASHSTLMVEGYSSSRFGRLKSGGVPARDYLVEVPEDVRVQRTAGEEGTEIVVAHDGYVRTHGLTHMRRLEFGIDGRWIVGEDTLAAVNHRQQSAFDRVLERQGDEGVRYAVRFHLHPEVEARLDPGGQSVTMTLRSGEIWHFYHDGVADLTLDRSVYLESGRLRPRATKQVVLSAAALDYASRIRWSLSKSDDVPLTIRDLQPDELPWLD